MIFNIIRLFRSVNRLVRKPSKWKFGSAGYCQSCNRRGIFLFSTELAQWLKDTTAQWKLSNEFKKSLLERENHMCCYCDARFRMRAHAEAVLKLLNMPDTSALIRKLKEERRFLIYETAAYNVFRSKKMTRISNYMISEYFEGMPFGVNVNNIRNENIEQLTFPDNTFDVLITSDVLEHVSDLEKALSEIKRVLKSGGFHVFTIPVDNVLQKTRERARIVNGKIDHLMEPVMHGDSIRPEGILAFRDFGGDVLSYLSRPGLECNEFKYFIKDKYITSVYYAQKKC